MGCLVDSCGDLDWVVGERRLAQPLRTRGYSGFVVEGLAYFQPSSDTCGSPLR
jgi:hypothetical protein